MNNEAPRKEEPPAAPRRRGRPRVWANEAEKSRGHRTRRSERVALLADLLDAVRNAHWEEPELQATINAGDDVAVLRALIAHYRSRHWMLRETEQSNRAQAQE